MIELLKRRADLFLLLAFQGLFLLWPTLDLAVSDWFYRPGEGFFLDSLAPVQWSYWLFARLHFVVAPLLLAYLLWTLWLRDRAGRGKALFLLLSLLLGPGLLVNEVLKAESGRARPQTVQQFGGERSYSAPFQPSDQCESNCSFVSGHTAMGFWFIALAWATGRRRWLWAGIGIGALVGLGRIAQGAHFLSDVIFSFWVVYGVCWLLAWLLFGRTRIEPAEV